MPPNDLSQCSDPVFMSGLIWTGDMGWYPISGANYDAAYWHKYEGYAKTERGKQLTELRVSIARFYCGDTVDVGIGCGQFVEAFDCKGFDINPVGVEWLLSRDRWHDPYLRPIHSATFWDSLEHINDVHRILRNIQVAVMSVPIVPGDGPPDETWKHFRKDEHCWYFTHKGLVRWMKGHGFRLKEHNQMEQVLGREDVGTYVFAR